MSRFIRSKVEVANPDATMVREHGALQARPCFDPKASNIFLVGLRGSGKTTLGRLLAERLEMAFVDTDEEVVRRAGQDIAAIVASQGWEGFRRLEAQTLQRICAGKGQVVATGGGVVMDPDNRELLDTFGVTFYLMADIPILAQRLAKDPNTGQRPALSDLALAQELGQCSRERGPMYMCVANHVLRAEKAPHILVEEVLEKLGDMT